MKKSSKKLTLNRETLRRLADSNLHLAGGKEPDLPETFLDPDSAGSRCDVCDPF